MAKKIEGYIKLQVPAGSATPSPPIGPALGQRGHRHRAGRVRAGLHVQHRHPALRGRVALLRAVGLQPAARRGAWRRKPDHRASGLISRHIQ